jgi:hypothetical protein
MLFRQAGEVLFDRAPVSSDNISLKALHFVRRVTFLCQRFENCGWASIKLQLQQFLQPLLLGICGCVRFGCRFFVSVDSGRKLYSWRQLNPGRKFQSSRCSVCRYDDSLQAD